MAPVTDRPAPALSSMTGFARAEGAAGMVAWAWELRSVNAKALDIRVRVPPGYDRFEALARAEVGRRFRRGSISAGLTTQQSEGTPALRVNRPVLDRLLALSRELEAAGAAPPRADGLLALRGVLEAASEEGEEAVALRDRAIERSLAEALDRLALARTEEGARLQAVLDGHLDAIAALVAVAGESAAVRPDAIRQRLREQVAALLEGMAPVPEDRLAQELALLLARGDVREELDRLAAHVAQARQLLAEAGAVGRRLDFLCQEFNREANTLCAKSADITLTRTGLDLKAAVEQLREQVQNIE